MNTSENKRKCPDCGNEMVSQKTKYQTGGIIIMVAGVIIAIVGIARIADGEMVDGLISIAAGAFFVWAGLRRVRLNPWFCTNCKTREFEKV
jgi:sulfite exporter TauE/SafE